MENLNISATTSSPQVKGDVDAGRLALEGESYPENSVAFYEPILAWLRDLIDQDERLLTIDLRLTYLNTSSIRCLMDMLEDVEEAHRAGRRVELNWYYDEENDRARELAEEFKEDLTLPFHVTAARGLG